MSERRVEGGGHWFIFWGFCSRFVTVPVSQSLFSFFGRLVLVDGLAMECPSLGMFWSLTLSYGCCRSILFDSPSSSLLCHRCYRLSCCPVYKCALLIYVVWHSARLFALIPLVWRIDAPCNRLLCVHGKLFWDQGLGQRIGCLSVQTSTQLLYVLCLRTHVRFQGFVHCSGGALRPVSNPVFRLPCWYVLMGIPVELEKISAHVDLRPYVGGSKRSRRGQSTCWCPGSLQR